MNTITSSSSQRLLRDRSLVQVPNEVAQERGLDSVCADCPDGLVGLVVEQQGGAAEAGEPADGSAEAVVELGGRDRAGVVLAEQFDEHVDRLIARGGGQLVYEWSNPGAARGLPAAPPDRRVGPRDLVRSDQRARLGLAPPEFG